MRSNEIGNQACNAKDAIDYRFLAAAARTRNIFFVSPGRLWVAGSFGQMMRIVYRCELAAHA
jgi:hypothetical protein